MSPLPHIRFMSEISDLGPQYLQYRREGGHRFLSILRLRMRNYDQYYAVAVTTVFFYDYFLTLADEVSHITNVSLR